MTNNHNHRINGKPCTIPGCWCRIFSTSSIADGNTEFLDLEDIVNEPKHYKLEGLEVEALDVIKASLSSEEYKGYLIGNCLKYAMRHKKKNNIEDIKKMCYYARELDDCT